MCKIETLIPTFESACGEINKLVVNIQYKLPFGSYHSRNPISVFI